MRRFVIPALILFSAPCWAKTDNSGGNCSAENAAKLVSLQGRLYFDAEGKGNWQEAHLDQAFCEGSRVRVENYGRASLLLPSGITLRLDEGTVLSLNGIAPSQPTLLDMVKGFVHFISRTPRQLKITTPIANAGPEGTEFALNVDAGQASLWVYEGAVKFFNEQGDLRLTSGQGARALAGQAPVNRLDIKPEDAVNWALYYPPLLPPAGGEQDGEIAKAAGEFRHGRADAALAILDGLPAEKQTPYFLKTRAAILLSAGRVEQAQADIRRLQAANLNDADGLALQSVIALAQNRKDQALELARRAAAADPKSPSAYSALSYAEQGRFELEPALKAAEQAAKLAPGDALAWARHAELELALGHRDQSRHSAQEALQRDPGLERTQTVTGFAKLLAMDAHGAQQHFQNAIGLDSTSPLPRLGLGLAKIRQGELEQGRRELEIAAVLDPNNAILRSYLGKAYYEEKRNGLAEDELQLAKQRDPKDPTPYFYDAINKLTTNRPVEALQDMQQAIDENQNRGVYRSSLALDKDLAARSAAQGRIYNELGFQQQGLLEGWKSANTDPDDYSAHRLLADDYAALPRHEIARVSELLQSQLLQPVNITPIQPNLAESSAFITNGLGPNELSYNEFNPLFEYNRLAVQASGFYGSNNTKGDNVAVSGLRDRASFSLGQFHYETDGFRENNYLRKDLYNAFLQGQVTDKLNLQAEYRHERSNNGDLSLNFDSNNFNSDFNENKNIDSYRLGGRYEFSPHSSVIGSLIYQNIDITQNTHSILDFGDFGIFFIPKKYETTRNGFISELQHHYSESKFSLITGFGHINQKIDRNSYITDTTSTEHFSPTRSNIYNYSTINISKNLSTTIGISVDFFNDVAQRLTPINPKFGIVWSPTNATTFRAAIVRNLSMTRTANQTIEPTQVAGFNQFFDDVDGTVAWRYGAGLDHKFSRSLASGLEYSERQLYIPGGINGIDRSEQLARAYLNYTPHAWLALSGEYFYERINQPNRDISPDNSLTGGLYDNVKTHRFPFTLGLFHPSGLSFKVKNSFVHQSGIFQNPNTLSSDYGMSNFFVVDLNLSYRLPGRHGMVTLGINNLFDDPICFQNTDYNQAQLIPGRMLFSRLSLSF